MANSKASQFKGGLGDDFSAPSAPSERRPGRPELEASQKQVSYIRAGFERHIVDQIEAEAARMGMKKATFVRFAVIQYLNEKNKEDD